MAIEGVQTVSLKAPEPEKQTQLFYKDGTPIAPADIPGAIAKGEAFAAGDSVSLTGASGQQETASREGLANVLANQGGHVETKREAHGRELRQDAESFSGMGKTAGEGLIRGATMGFLGPEQFYDAEGRERAQARVQFNPKIAAGSEMAGAIGAAIAASALTGGGAAPEALEGAGSRIAALAARGALTPFRAASLLGDAAEGAAGGLGLGEGLLGRGLAMGARGAAEGGIMGVGHEVSQSALENVPLTAERLLAGAWDGAKAGGAFGAGLGVLGAGVSKAGRAILGRMSETGEGMEGAVGTWAERRAFKQAVGNNGKIFDRASNFGQDMARPARIGRKLLDAEMPTDTRAALKRVGELADGAVERMSSVAREMDEAGVVADTSSILSKVDDQIAKLRETPIGDFQAVADRVEKQIAPFREQFTQNAAAANDTIPSMSFSDLWKMRQSLDKTLKWETQARGPAQEALRDMVGAFRSEIDDSIARAAESGAVSPELSGAWKKATEDYSDYALARDGLKDLAKRQDKNRWMSPSDYGTGGVAGLMVGILTGQPLAGMATQLVTSAAHKLIRERGAGVIARIADRAASVAGRMDMAGKVAAMVESPKAIAIPAAVSVAQGFERYSSILSDAKADPAKFTERLASATADLQLRAPELAQQVQTTMLGDLQYLDQLHPSPTSRVNTTLTPQAKLPQFYSFNQKKAFVDAATALDNPLGVFEDLARGDLPMTKIQALKDRRPQLWDEMRGTVIKYTSQRQEELPFNRRMLLGAAFDFDSDWSVANIASIQMTVSTAQQPAPTSPKASLSKVDQKPGEQIQTEGF